MTSEIDMISIGAIEAAINRCNATQGRGTLRNGPDVPADLPQRHIVLSKDAGLLAEVYGMMIFSHRERWPLDSFTTAQREAFLRWQKSD